MKNGLSPYELAQICSVFKTVSSVEKAVLFGSRAMGLARSNSDVDIMLYGDDLKMQDVMQIDSLLDETSLPYQFDLIRHDTQNPDLLDHVERYGKVIFQRRKVSSDRTSCSTSNLGDVKKRCRLDMKYEWQTVHLSDVVSILGDGLHGTPKYDDDGEYYFINGNNLADGEIVFKNDTKKVAFFEYEKYKKNLNDRTILVSINGTLGNVAIYNGEKCILGKSACYFNVKDDVDKYFIKYVVSTEIFQDYIRRFANGTTIKNVSLRVMRDYQFDLPSLDEQRKIADTLRVLDDKITNNTKINHHLEQMALAIFKNWVVDFVPSKAFTDVVNVLGGGTPKTGNAEYWDGSIPFFTPKDALSIYALTTEKLLTKVGLDNCNSRLYPVNTVFVTARGTVGKLAMAGTPMAMNQSCYALIGKNGYGQHFVYHLALETIERLKHKASGAVFDAIVTRDFESELVSDPPPEAVKSFEDKVKPIYATILNNSNESARLSTLRDTILPRLMSGELSVADLGEAK